MPYIKQKERDEIDEHLTGLHSCIFNAGQLNYAITKLCDMYLNSYGKERYIYYNEVMGVLTCAQLELYRRKVSAYEDKKLDENGDVYDWVATLENVTPEKEN